MSYVVHITKKATKKFAGLRDADLKARLKEAFALLSDPFNLDTVKIKGGTKMYRTRIGKYRILFILEKQIVLVFDFDTRGKIYK